MPAKSERAKWHSQSNAWDFQRFRLRVPRGPLVSTPAIPPPAIVPLANRRPRPGHRLTAQPGLTRFADLCDKFAACTSRSTVDGTAIADATGCATCSPASCSRASRTRTRASACCSLPRRAAPAGRDPLPHARLPPARTGRGALRADPEGDARQQLVGRADAPGRAVSRQAAADVLAGRAVATARSASRPTRRGSCRRCAFTSPSSRST